MKFKKHDRVIYNNLKGKVRDVIIERRQITIWVEFDNIIEIGLFNQNGYLGDSDKQYGEKYRLMLI